MSFSTDPGGGVREIWDEHHKLFTSFLTYSQRIKIEDIELHEGKSQSLVKISLMKLSTILWEVYGNFSNKISFLKK